MTPLHRAIQAVYPGWLLGSATGRKFAQRETPQDRLNNVKPHMLGRRPRAKPEPPNKSQPRPPTESRLYAAASERLGPARLYDSSCTLDGAGFTRSWIPKVS
jgi:hypothetical protein